MSHEMSWPGVAAVGICLVLLMIGAMMVGGWGGLIIVLALIGFPAIAVWTGMA